MKRIVFLNVLLIIAKLIGCQDASNNKNNEPPTEEEKEITIKEYYESKMVEKDFTLTINGPCDDALEDTIHEWYMAYIDLTEISDSSTIVEFKFIHSCCQDFLGDYKILNDTLVFEFEQVDGVCCDCVCWYRYKLVLNNVKENFTEISIKEKR